MSLNINADKRKLFTVIKKKRTNREKKKVSEEGMEEKA